MPPAEKERPPCAGPYTGARGEEVADPCSKRGFHILYHQVRFPGSSHCEKQKRLFQKQAEKRFCSGLSRSDGTRSWDAGAKLLADRSSPGLAEGVVTGGHGQGVSHSQPAPSPGKLNLHCSGPLKGCTEAREDPILFWYRVLGMLASPHAAFQQHRYIFIFQRVLLPNLAFEGKLRIK